MRVTTYIACWLSALAFIACKGERDAALRKIYSEGIEYLQNTRALLEKTNTAEGATEVVEKSLPTLQNLVKRKQALEARYPEIAIMATREEFHSQFIEFKKLRIELQKFMAYGNTLVLKYKHDAPFQRAVRKGLNILAYF